MLVRMLIRMLVRMAVRMVVAVVRIVAVGAGHRWTVVLKSRQIARD